MGQVIGWLTHYNKPIPETFEGARTAVNYHLRMIDPGTGAQAWDSGEMFFVIDVLETNNYTVCCPDGNENGTPPNQSGCADRFRVGILADYDGDGDIDADDLLSAPVGSSFDEEVDTFTYRGVEYSVRLSGFWEAGEEGPVLKGEGWSPEYDFTHFEVRAEVWAGEAGKSREKESDASEEAPRVSCEPA